MSTGCTSQLQWFLDDWRTAISIIILAWLLDERKSLQPFIVMEMEIKIAALQLSKKLEKAHMKHEKTKSFKSDWKDCRSCQTKIEELECGKKSPIVMSPTTSGKVQRRRGVSERNPTEGKLVREAIKVAFVCERICSLGFEPRYRENEENWKWTWNCIWFNKV